MAKKENSYPRCLNYKNRIIGLNLKNLRLEAGLSRQEVSGVLDISVQQLQKYESGKNRLPVDRLYILKQILNVPFERFFEKLDLKIQDYGVEPIERDPVANEVYQKVAAVKNKAMKLKIRDVIRVMAD